MIFAYILLGIIISATVLGYIAFLAGLVYAKTLERFSLSLGDIMKEDFCDCADSKIGDMSCEICDSDLANFAKDWRKKEDRRIGFYRTYMWDENKKWWLCWHFQFMKFIKINFPRIPLPKRKQLW